MSSEPGKIVGVRVPDQVEGPPCSRCGGAGRILAIARRDARGRARRLVELCAECLADALEVATGYLFRRQMAHWDRFSAVSSELAAESHRSRQARSKKAERDSARAARQERIF